MAKKAKNTKHIDNADKAVTETGSKKPDISDAFLDAFKSAFTSFDKIETNKKIELYGDKDYLEQFRAFFSKEYPYLLDTIDKKDLPIYIKAIEDKWFSIKNITENTKKLHEEFASDYTESHVIEKSLDNLRKFCDDKINNIPDNTFNKFASKVWFTHDTLVISPDGSIKNVDGLPMLWKKFLDNEGITLGKTSAEHAEKILTPDYNPTERLMVTVAITKIRKELKGSLKTAFDLQFPLPIDIFTSYRDLLTFKVEWTQFLDDHASQIDAWLAKKLDDVIVTNGDIYKELRASWRDFDDTKWFSEWEQYFRRIFNNLVTRQLFEEVQKNKENIDSYVVAMGETFKQFPPYVNTILEVYPFNDTVISAIDTSFHADMHAIEDQIVDLDAQFKTAPDEKKQEFRDKIKALRQQREHRRWVAYIAFLRTKDAGLADVFTQLVGSKFDFSVLSQDHQQLILNVLIKNKLEDSIKNKIPEILDVKEEELTQFVQDLFDLKKMDLTIPTRYGPVPLTFLRKEFLGGVHSQLPAISDLDNLKNIPLNFVTQLTDANAKFFEDGPIFDSLYTNFAAKNGNFRFNEGYKVTITKDGKPVTWYLSSYCPIDEYNQNREERNGKELYLYSQPMTVPSQERTLMTWPHEEWKLDIPVVIKEEEQASCDIQILDKQLNLNGDAFWALLFGYVLGQQSMNTALSPQKEKELADKLGTLNVYTDKEDGKEEDALPETDQPKEKTPEVSKYKQFYDDFHKLKWHSFPEEHRGFVPWTKLFMPFDSSKVPPEWVGNARLQMEITHVDTDKWTFKVKIRGWELRLGKSEWATKELPMTSESLESIKKAFSRDIYKVPDMKGKSFSQQIQLLTQWAVIKDLDNHFGTLHTDWSTFNYALWNYSGKEITHFGIYEPKRIGEDVDKESGNLILYKIHPNANGTITVSGDSTKNNYAKHFPARDMDYVSFMLFVKDKWLQPKCKDQIQDIQKKADVEKEETPTTVHWFSINNIIGFFKNGVSKIKDSIKKYDDERTEDLTDTLTNQGQLWWNIWWFLSPFSRISSSFETMGMEYFLERDNRVWKKVEKRQKFYEDYDYTKLYKQIILPMLSWQIAIVPHYKIAAILLAHLKKGKWPYAKNLSPDKGQWIGVLLGKDHQARYLAIREKRIRDLEENAHVYGTQWADQIKNELVELEMRYIVHIMDGRHMWMDDNDKTKYYFQDKYSKKFCDTLEEVYVPFFKQSTVDEWFTKNQDVNFEFARVEYFRLLADRPQQALPFLKVMATKAINSTQWQVFETAVMVGMLSGVFLNMTFSSTQVYIQKICRTRWFVPWIFARDIHQQSKLQRLLDLYSNNKFTSENAYNPADYSYRKNTLPGAPGGIMSKLINSKSPGKGRLENPQRMREISDFLCFKWKNTQDKTLLDLYADPKLPMADKLLLEEYIDKSNEKNEWLDPQVQENTSSLTWSILTKSQSVVEQMIHIDQDGFAGKNGDEKYNMEEFSKEMKDAIPSNESISSETKVDFFVKKFFNRFSVFSWTKKTDFIKRLMWCQKNKWRPEVDDIMYYSVVGEIISSISKPPAHVPEELEWALNAWKDFFVNNMEIILRPSIIASSFGPQHVSDLAKAPLLEPWANAAILLDREDKSTAMYWLSKDEQKPLKDTQQRLRNPNYINKPLYDLADMLYKRCWVTNRFKKDAGNYANKEAVNHNATSTQIKKATWAKIKNPKVIEQVRQILEGKNIEEEPDQYPPMDDFDDDFGMTY